MIFKNKYYKWINAFVLFNIFLISSMWLFKGKLSYFALTVLIISVLFFIKFMQRIILEIRVLTQHLEIVTLEYAIIKKVKKIEFSNLKSVLTLSRGARSGKFYLFKFFENGVNIFEIREGVSGWSENDFKNIYAELHSKLPNSTTFEDLTKHFP
jgi:hypothetical protein